MESGDLPPQPRLTGWQRLGRLPLAMILTSLLAALGIVQLSFQLGNTVYRSVTWMQETQKTQAHIRQLERDVRVLQDAEKNANDPTYLRQLARCQGFIGVNEKIIVSPDAPDTPGENCQEVRLP